MTEQTLTPQNAFPLVGKFEDKKRICAIAHQMVGDEVSGLVVCALGDEEVALLAEFTMLLNSCQETTCEQWAGIKEQCLALIGSPVATTVDHLCSALRTPAIAESALWSAGHTLIEANQRKARATARRFMRSLFTS